MFNHLDYPEVRRDFMKKVVVGIQNGLLAEAITAMLSNNGEFQPYRTKSGKQSAVVQDCVLVNADILLLETTYAEESSLQRRLDESRKVRSQLPDCKIVFLCDENSAPDIARSICNAKKDGVIDAFFYTSVSSTYLLDALDAL